MKSDSLRLYAVTDRHWTQTSSLYDQVKFALDGGVTMVQLREKEHFNIEEAKSIQALCKEYQVPFIINDDVELAYQLQADGVHVGQSDASMVEARKRLGPSAIIGVSTQTKEQALLAQKQGADYLGVGAIFPTGSKADADDVSMDTLKTICDAVDIPVVAIGGITQSNIVKLKDSGIVGVAVISAIFGQSSIQEATQALKESCNQYFGEKR